MTPARFGFIASITCASLLAACSDSPRPYGARTTAPPPDTKTLPASPAPTVSNAPTPAPAPSPDSPAATVVTSPALPIPPSAADNQSARDMPKAPSPAVPAEETAKQVDEAKK